MELKATIEGRVIDAVKKLHEDMVDALERGEKLSDRMDYQGHTRGHWRAMLFDTQQAEIQGANDALAAVVRVFRPGPEITEVDRNLAAKIALVSTQVVNDINQLYDQLRAGLDRSICQIQAGNVVDGERMPECVRAAPGGIDLCFFV